MPTTNPRYTLTDSGALRELLDDAQHRWPDVHDRKELLLRLARAGHQSLNADEPAAELRRRAGEQRAALASLQRAVDWDAIRDDQAWR
jgi:hypothetical protein